MCDIPVFPLVLVALAMLFLLLALFGYPAEERISPPKRKAHDRPAREDGHG
jgi:hypothetical protein